MKHLFSVKLTLRQIISLLALLVAGFAVPSSAQAISGPYTDPWCNLCTIAATNTKTEPTALWPVRVYCEEKDSGVKNIGAGGNNSSYFVYGATYSYQDYTYGDYFQGRCKNPHSVSFPLYAHSVYYTP